MDSGDYLFGFGAVMATDDYIVFPVSNKDWKIHSNIWLSLKENKYISTSEVLLNDGTHLSLYPRATFGDYFLTINDQLESILLSKEITEDETLEVTFYKLK